MERRLSILLIRVLLVLGYLSGGFLSAYAQGKPTLTYKGDKVEAKWQSVSGVVGYQLEWTHVNSYGGSLPVDFKNGSTRIETTGTSYDIPVIYENGYLHVRVRTISKSTSGRIIAGNWSASSQTQVASNDKDKMNWQAMVDFSEEGKNKEVMTYYDGTMRARQMVTRNSENNDILVGETYYDHQGRAAVQSLPAPTLRSNDSISYHDAFNVYDNENEGVIPYDRRAFDVSGDVPCDVAAKPMLPSSGSSLYYSPSNNEKSGYHAYIPDAEGYPFSQTEYTPDNTGRIRRQGNVGPQYQLGADTDSTHFTSYYYGKPTQEDLWKLFGSQCGDFSHYQKNMTIDPNGSITVTYVDMHGRTIATALAGDNAKSLEKINSPGTNKPMIVNLLDRKDTPKEGETVSVLSTPFLVSSPGTYNFTYADTLKNFRVGNVCLDCKYLLKISVVDECGNEMPLVVGTDTFSCITDTLMLDANSSSDCDAKIEILREYEFFTKLYIGKYQITRTLEVDAKSQLERVEKVVEESVTSLSEIIEGKKEKVDIYDECYVKSCSSTCAQGNEDYDAYLECMASCESRMDTNTSCVMLRDIMVADFVPGEWKDDKNSLKGETEEDSVRNKNQVDGGQYAAYEIKNGEYVGRPYTIFDTIVSKDNFKTIRENEAFLKVVDESGVSRDSVKTIAGFVRNFRSVWAEFLAKSYHPEWAKDRDCEEEKDMMHYQRKMFHVETYDQAVEAGMFNPLDGNNSKRDTFVYSRTGLKDALVAKMNDFQGEGSQKLSMKESAFISAVSNDFDSTRIRNEIMPLLKDPDFKWPMRAYGNDGCLSIINGVEVNWDKVWYTFRSLYLNQRRFSYEENKAKAPINGLLLNKKTLEEAEMTARFTDYDKVDESKQDYENEEEREDLSNRSKLLSWTYSLNQAKAHAENVLSDIEGCLNSFKFAENGREDSMKTVKKELVKILAYSSYRSGAVQGYSSIPPEMAVYDSSTDPDSMANYQPKFYSIESLLSHYFVIKDSCNADLLTGILPYGELDPDSEIKPLDVCGCEMIIQMADSFKNGLKRPNRVYKPRVYFDDDTTGVSLHDFNAMLCLCKTVKEIYNDEWTQEAEDSLRNSGYTIPAAIACDECASCDTVARLMSEYQLFVDKYHPQDDKNVMNHIAYSLIEGNMRKSMVNYLNRVLRMTKSFDEYRDFAKKCHRVYDGETISECELTYEAKRLVQFLNDLLLRHSLTGAINDSRIYKDIYDFLSVMGTTLGGSGLSIVEQGYVPYGHKVTTKETSVSTGRECTGECASVTFTNSSENTFEMWVEDGRHTTSRLVLEGGDGFDLEDVQWVDGCFCECDPTSSRVGLIVKVTRGADVVTDTLFVSYSDWNLSICKTYSSGAELQTCQSKKRDIVNFTDECKTDKIRTIIYESKTQYVQQADTIRSKVTHEYLSKCYGGLTSEKFDMDYTERELHYTLYYYDQAGNLVRTVPPAGVEFVDVDANRKALENDLKNGTQSVFTKHRLETRYVYNSFNQLVYQYMPDHEGFDYVYSPKNQFDYMDDKQVKSVAFDNTGVGFSAVYDPAEKTSSLYASDKNGENWKEVSYSESRNLVDVKTFPSGITLAGGKGGALLKKTAGSDRWIVDPANVTNNVDIVSVVGVNAPIIYTEKGDAFVMNVQNGSWSNTAKVSNANIRDVDMSSKRAVAVSGSSIYVSGVSGGKPSSWRQLYASEIELGKIHSIAMDGSVGYANGDNGLLLKSVDGGATWSIIPSDQKTAFTEMCMVGSEKQLYALKSNGDLMKYESNGTFFKIASNVAHISGGDNLYCAVKKNNDLKFFVISSSVRNFGDLLSVSGVNGFAFLRDAGSNFLYYTNTAGDLYRVDVWSSTSGHQIFQPQKITDVSKVKSIVASNGKLYVNANGVLSCYNGQGNSLTLSASSNGVWSVNESGRYVYADKNQLMYADNVGGSHVSNVSWGKFNAVSVMDNGEAAYVVGDNGIVLYSSGSSQNFKLIPAVTSENLLSVDCNKVGNTVKAFIGGANGTLLTSSNGQVSEYAVTGNPGEDIASVRLYNDGTMFLGTQSGSVAWVRTQDNQNKGWNDVSFGVNAIDCSSGKVWLVGEHGQVIESEYK